MPAVEKKYKPSRVDEPQQNYHTLVTPSDEAFGFFCLKNYNDYTSYIKGKEKISKSPQTYDVTRNRKDKIGGKNSESKLRIQ